jgi:hypothetical protein
MLMLVIHGGVEIIIVNVPPVPNWDSGSGKSSVVVGMTIFKYDISLCMVNMASILGWKWRRSHVKTLMDMPISNGGVVNRAMRMIGDEARIFIVFTDFHHHLNTTPQRFISHLTICSSPGNGV